MPAYRAIPLLRPLIALMLGILAGYQFPYWNITLILIVFAAFLLLLFSFRFFSFEQKIRLYWVSGISIWGIFFLLGYFAVSKNDPTKKADWIGNKCNTSQKMVLVLNENPSRKTKTFLTQANAIAVDSVGIYQKVSGKILLQIDTSIQNQYALSEGDTIFITTALKSIQTYPNSNFDIATYYRRQQIHFQTKATSENLIDIHPNTSHNVTSFLHQSQTRILDILRNNIPNKDNLGLAEALLIGYKDDLDKTLVNAYRDAGIIHIIAISGMHLMLLYELLKWTGFLFFKNLKTRKVIQLLSLFVIWLFAFLTGGGPSVIRAAVMLTFLVVGEAFYRNNNLLNSLVASAFVLLLVMPEWIWNVGFWLSYMAVLGILLFYKSILQWPDFENIIVRNIWSGIAVTLAAQILTVPILMYCFGKIPLYFLFTNLLMVPLSSIILYGIIGLLVVGKIHFLANILGKTIDFLIGWMNAFVKYVAQYPLANISVSIGFIQMLLLFGIIGIVYYLMLKRQQNLSI